MSSTAFRSIQDDTRRVKNLMEHKPQLTLEEAAKAFAVGVGITGKKQQQSWARKIVKEANKKTPTPRSTIRTKPSLSKRQLTLEQINLARESHEDVVPVDDSETGTRQLRLL